MNYFIPFLTAFFHLVLPVILLLWVSFNKGTSHLYRWSVFIFSGTYIIIMKFIGAGWSSFGLWWGTLYLVLLIPAAILFLKNTKGFSWLPKKKIIPWLGTVLVVLLAFSTASGISELFGLKKFAGEGLELEFPMKNGSFFIVHGGAREGSNHHFPVRAQRYALDILKINKYRIRSKKIIPVTLSDFEIFEEKLFAPCSGQVIGLENNKIDNELGKMDPEVPAGNHIVIYCKGHSVVIAHMKNGSVLLKKGDQVKAGDLIGRVGNSGNTSEPHLHIHAVKGKHFVQKEIAYEAEGVAMLFDKEFFIRNEIVEN